MYVVFSMHSTKRVHYNHCEINICLKNWICKIFNGNQIFKNRVHNRLEGAHMNRFVVTWSVVHIKIGCNCAYCMFFLKWFRMQKSFVKCQISCASISVTPVLTLFFIYSWCWCSSRWYATTWRWWSRRCIQDGRSRLNWSIYKCMSCIYACKCVSHAARKNLSFLWTCMDFIMNMLVLQCWNRYT